MILFPAETLGLRDSVSCRDSRTACFCFLPRLPVCVLLFQPRLPVCVIVSPAETHGLRNYVFCRDSRHSVSRRMSLQETQSHGQSRQEAMFADSILGNKI